MRASAVRRLSRPGAIALAAILLASAAAFAAVQITAPEQAGALTLTDAALVDFTVLHRDGTPAANVPLMLYDTEGSLHIVWVTDAHGKAQALFSNPSADTAIVFDGSHSGEGAHLILDLTPGMHISRTVALIPADQLGPVIVDFGVLLSDGKPAEGAVIALDDGRKVDIQITEDTRSAKSIVGLGKGTIRAGTKEVVVAGSSGKAQVGFLFPQPEIRLLVFARHDSSDESARVTLRLKPGSHTSRWVRLAPMPDATPDQIPKKAAESASAPSAQPGAPDDKIVFFTIDLKYLDGAYVAWLFGYADLPAGGGAVKGKGSLAGMVPEGIRTLTPVGSPGLPSTQLLVSGTVEAVAKLREVVGLVDHYVQQVFVETSFFAAPKATASSLPTYTKAMGPLPREFTTAPGGSRGWDGRTGFYQRRLTISNLGLKYVIIPAMEPVPQMILGVTPRVNGDRTVTMTLTLSMPSADVEPAQSPAGHPFWEQVVNARSMEASAVELSHGSWTATLVVRPLLLPKGPV